MWPDVWTVFWKEWKEFLTSSGRRGKWSPLIFLVIFGIAMPVQTGRMWLETPVSLAYFGWIPFMMGSGWAADSFAGERERHTLETLLATRLPDGAIFLGKLLTIVSYSWGMVLVSFFVSAAAVNVATWNGQITFYPPYVLGAGAGLALLVAVMATSLGVLISLKAKTVRQAQQKMSIGVLLIAWGPILVLNVVPDAWKAGLRSGLGQLTSAADLQRYMLPGLIGIVALLVGIDVILVLAARKRFRRARLISERA